MPAHAACPAWPRAGAPLSAAFIFRLRIMLRFDGSSNDATRRTGEHGAEVAGTLPCLKDAAFPMEAVMLSRAQGVQADLNQAGWVRGSAIACPLRRRQDFVRRIVKDRYQAARNFWERAGTLSAGVTVV